MLTPGATPREERPVNQIAAPPFDPARPLPAHAGIAGGLRFDWLMTVLAAWVVVGLFIDGWAHTHGMVDASFFTPYHALLYAGLLATLLVLTAVLVANRTRGAAWDRALPDGYGLSLVGALLFALGGGVDLAWHTLFGVESNVEALISPSHLVLALGGWLIVGGPFRAAWGRATPARSWSALLPMLLALTGMLSLLTFFTQIAHPVPNPHFWGGPAPVGRGLAHVLEEMGIVSLLLTSGLVMGMILLTIRRWALPVGALTLVLTLNAALMSLLSDDAPPVQALLLAATAAAVAGLGADLLFQRLRPSVQRPRALRLFAFLTPAAIAAANFAVVGLAAGLWWSVHLWAGAILLTGVVGLLLSYLLARPAIPREA
jgi:hypothetical protein